MLEISNAETRLPKWTVVMTIIGLFFLATLIVYGRSLSNNFISLDDPYVIYHNLAIRGLTLTHLKQMFTMYDPELYTPLTFLSFALDYLRGGLEPFQYHLTNLFLHTLNALLVAWVMLQLIKNRALALFLGLLFALHPVNTEVVAWVTARKEVLSTFFFLSSLLGFLYYRENGRMRFLALSIILFTLGLLSKVTVFTLPVLLLLINWRERRPISKRTAREIGPFFALSILFGIIGLFPKSQILASTTMVQKILMAAKSTIFYLWKFIVPTGLSVFYPNNETVSLLSPGFLVSLTAFLVLIGGVLLTLKKTREIAFGFGFFLIAIAPTFVHFNRNTSIASGPGIGLQFAYDHYMYLPSLGLLFLVGAGILWFIHSSYRLDVQWKRTVSIAGLGTVILFVFGIMSALQSQVWATSEALFTHTLKLYPFSATARVNLSVIYHNTGRFDDEKRVLEEGLAFGPNSRLYTGLGAIAVRENNILDAERQFALAEQTDPANAEPYFSRGAMLAGMKKLDEALKEYETALVKDPQYAAAYNNIGSIKLQQGKNSEAEEAFRHAIVINPTLVEGTYNLALLFETEKRQPEAITQFERVIELEPDSIDARIELIPLYLETGKTTRALQNLKEVLRLDPKNETAKAILQEMVRRGIVGVKK